MTTLRVCSSLLLALLLLPSQEAQGQRPGSDWPKFLGPAGDSTSPEKGIVSPWPKDGLRIVWQTPIGEGYSAPVISAGKLFLFEREGGNARVRCLDAVTGKAVWTFDYPTAYRDRYGYNGGPRCCPVVDDDRVYVLGVEGMLHCLKVSDGKLVWKVDTKAEFGVVQNFFGVGSTPIIEGDWLIAQIGGSPPGSDKEDFASLKGNGSGIVAFDKRTGKVGYKITDELASYSSPVVATIDGRRWCFVLARGGLVAFEPKTGKVDFQFPWRAEDLESANASNPVVIGDKVLITECYGPGSALLKVRPGGYEVVWSDAKKKLRDKSLMCHWMTPVHHEGYLYGSSGRHTNNAELRCVELATGKVTWSEPRLSRISLLLVDNHLVAQTEVGPLLLLRPNPKKYDEVSLWEPKDPKKKTDLVDYPCWAGPVLAHGLLYVRGPENLVCFELISAKK